MAFFEFVFIVYNLFFNIAWNRWWANGNIWLLVNTFYLIWQCFISLIIAFEYPLFMRAFRVFRFFTLLAALYYNFWFGLVLFEWGRELWLETDKSKYELIDIMVNMFLIYNAILHFPVMIVNGFIISKEFSLEFW